MERLPDLLRSIREDLRDATSSTEQAANDAGTEDSPYWDMLDELNDAADLVDSACKQLPEED